MLVSSIVIINGNRASTKFLVTALVLENGKVNTVSEDVFSDYKEAFAFTEKVKAFVEDALSKVEVNSKYNFAVGGV